jgi:hypothetical protein
LYANTYLSTGWNATAGATGYVLYRSTRANGIYDVVIDTTSINYMDNFNTGITYHYQVLAYSELIIPHEVVQYLQLLMVVVVVF